MDNHDQEERAHFLDRVFFEFVDREEDVEGKIWRAAPRLPEIAQRLEAFRAHLRRQPLTRAERRELLEAYKVHLLVKCAASGLPERGLHPVSPDPTGEGKGRRAAMNPMVAGYVAAMLHDGKKLLLCRDSGERYGTWGPDHLRWDKLDRQGPLDDLFPESSHVQSPQPPLEPEVVQLIKLHQNVSQKADLGLTSADLQGIDALTVASLRAADALHKALYFGDDVQVGTIPVAKQFPFYYPFYGRPVVWVPAPQTPSNDFCWDVLPTQKARERFLELWNRLEEARKQPGVHPQPLDLVAIQSDLLGDFPESTYLPVTSLGFHQRLVTALFLLLHQELKEKGLEFQGKDGSFSISLYLNTIISPPERLTNRLRDTSTVRKISHLLQQKIHSFLKERYLAPLDGDLDFRHCDHNPFFFYNKDALLIINRKEDQERIQQECREVARQTESLVTLFPVRIDGNLALTLQKNPVSQASLASLTAADLREVKAQTNFVQELHQSLWTPSVCVPSQPAEAIYFCSTCNKALPQEPRSDSRGDRLCPTCWTFRNSYSLCPTCEVLYLKQENSCPYGGHSPQDPRTPRLLQGTGRDQDGAGHRVAYVLVKVNATYESLRQEAEALLSRFRADRGRFERLSEARQKELQRNLARVRPTRFGLFEYLQAAQDIHRFQKELKDNLCQVLQGLEQRRQRRKPDSYEVTSEDYQKESLETDFLYRSPTLTLVVMPEDALPSFYRKLREQLDRLQISHCVRMVTCRYNHPVWMVLRHLGLQEAGDPFGDMGRKAALEELWKQREILDNGNQGGQEEMAHRVLKASQKFQRVFQEEQEQRKGSWRLSILRGGVERTFTGKLMNFLLTWNPQGQASSQLGNLSEFASRLLTEMKVFPLLKQKKVFQENLLLELDAHLNNQRKRDKERIPQEIVHALREWLFHPDLEPEETPGLLRELAIREI